MTHIKEGDTAPNFNAHDQSGKNHSLKDHRGKHVLLYFYPRDEEGEAAAEAENFAKMMKDFQALNTDVIGVSADDENSHKRFAKDHKVNYPLIADKGLSIAQNYGVAKGKAALYASFLIDPEGKVERVYDAVYPRNHAKEVAHDLRSIVGKDERDTGGQEAAA